MTHLPRAIWLIATVLAGSARAAPQARTARGQAYFEELIRAGALSPAAIDRMLRTHAKTGRVGNPMRFASGPAELVRRREIDAHLGDADHEALAGLLGEQRELLENELAQTDALREGGNMPLRFIRLEPRGLVQIPVPPDKELWFQLERPLEVLDRHVTQGQWMARLGFNPSHFDLGPNYPVDSVASRRDQFLRALDTEFPAYRHRLPTDREWMYIASDQALNRKQIAHGFDEAAILAHAWLEENSDGKPHEVATRKPTFVAGKPIHDLLGLVGDSVQSSLYQKAALGGWFGSKSPTSLTGYSNLIVHGSDEPWITGLRVVREETE